MAAWCKYYLRQSQAKKKRNKAMRNKNKARIFLRSLLLFHLFVSFFSAPLLPQAKKVRVTVPKANIYLKPDESSLVIGTVEKGVVLTLGSVREIKRKWFYVFFSSEKTGMTKSGYIITTAVEKLFEETRVETIRDEGLLVKHFRQAHWGMSKERVTELEGEPVHQKYSEGLERVGFRKKVKDLDCLIEYVFTSNKLVQARYVFLVEHEFQNEFIGDYKKVKDYLIEQHGEPEESKVIWMNDIYRDDYSRWGLAISLGYLEYFSFWKAEETEILLRLFGLDERIRLEAVYTGVKLAMKESVRQKFKKRRPQLEF